MNRNGMTISATKSCFYKSNNSGRVYKISINEYSSTNGEESVQITTGDPKIAPGSWGKHYVTLTDTTVEEFTRMYLDKSVDWMGGRIKTTATGGTKRRRTRRQNKNKRQTRRR